jgi:LPXTG-motif cell wall-anchored protein
MNKAVSLTLLVAGIVLVILGIIAMDSLASSFSKFFTGSPTDKSIWMLIAGAVLVAISGFGLFRGSKEAV